MIGGRVRFVIRTAMAERLISRAAEEGVRFERLSRPDARTLDAWVNAADEKRLRALLDGFSIEYRAAEAAGLVRFARFLRKRAALLPSVAAALILVFALSARIWVVDVQNARDADAVLLALSDMGVRPGVSKKSLDFEALSRRLEARLPEYAFFGVKASGVYLMVDARAADKAPEVYARADARDLTASDDGVVLRVDAAAGRALVRPGDTVRRGDVLIAGEERVSASGETERVRAQGSVIARLWTEGFAVIPLTREERLRTGRASESVKLVTPFFEKRLSGNNPFADYETERETMAVVGLFLPASLVRETAFELKNSRVSLEASCAKAAAEAFARARARKSAPEGAAETGFLCEAEARDGVMRARCAMEWEKEIAQ